MTCIAWFQGHLPNCVQERRKHVTLLALYYSMLGLQIHVHNLCHAVHAGLCCLCIMLNQDTFGIDWDAPLPTGDEAESVSVPDIVNPLTGEEFTELQATISPSTDDDNYGVDVYTAVVHFIQSRI